MRSEFTFDETDALTRGRIDVFDTACPRWSPHRKPHHQRLPCIHCRIAGQEHRANEFVYEQVIHGDILRCVYILGVDPGIRGGLAIVFVDANGTAPQLVDAIDIPVTDVAAKEQVDALAIRSRIVQHAPRHALIERTQAMPKQEASSGFKYGRATGTIEAVIACCAIPLTIVEPSIWRKFHQLRGGDKEAGRQRALQLFPAAHPLLARKKDHGRAEAALIALSGLKQEFLRIQESPTGRIPANQTR